jgi:hypothetical protein
MPPRTIRHCTGGLVKSQSALAFAWCRAALPDPTVRVLLLARRMAGFYNPVREGCVASGDD